MNTSRVKPHSDEKLVHILAAFLLISTSALTVTLILADLLYMRASGMLTLFRMTSRKHIVQQKIISLQTTREEHTDNQLLSPTQNRVLSGLLA